jgi:cytochrome c peroxidase
LAEDQLGIPVSHDENKKIVLFLKTLTGKQPRIVFPILPPSNGNTPRPDRG